MKNKKIIALICAVSMIFSLFTAFSITASAATKGIILETESISETEAVITAKYVGFDEGVYAGTVAFTYPEGATVTVKTDNFAVGGTFNTSNGKAIYPFFSADNKKTEDDIIAQFTVTLPEALTKNYTCKLVEPTDIAAIVDEAAGVAESYSVADETMSAATTIIPADPDKTPEPVLPKPPVVDPSANPLPEGKDPVNVTKGIVLTAELAEDGMSAEVTAKYVGFENGIYAGTVAFTYPEGATVTVKTDNFAVGGTFNTSNGKAIYPFFSADNVKTEDDIIAVFNVAFASALTDDAIFELVEPTDIAAIVDEAAGVAEAYSIADETLPAAWVKVEGGESMPNQIPLIKGADGVGLVADPGELGPDAYAALEVTKKNGDPAVYGVDYVAYYKGEKLTEAQLNNLLAGAYVDENNSLVDLLKGVVLHYNDGITATLQIVDNGEVVASGTTTPTSGGDKDKNPQSGSITPAKTTKTVYVGDSVSLKLTTKAAKDTSGSNMPYNDKVESVAINVDAASYNVLSATGITIEYVGLKSGATEDTKANRETKKFRVNINNADEDVVIPHSLDNTYTIKFTPLAKTPKDEPIDFTVTYTDANKTTSEAVATYKVNEKSSGSSSSSSSGGSGSSSDKNSSDVLANGNNGLLNGLLGGVSPFTDMAGYDWAQEAVNALAAKNIISGRGDGTFDPGGQVTRAEYAQMLINAIGKSGDYADTSFLDVPTDAWFYHNVAVAAQLDIVRGYGDGNFGPYDLITREQMALMTQKAAIVMNKSLSGAAVGAFSDDADIADWAKAAVYDLANVGIINGMGDGTFAPKANATRAQAAVIIYSAFIK